MTWLQFTWPPHSTYGLCGHRWPARCPGFWASCPVPQESVLPTLPFLRGVSAAPCDTPLRPLLATACLLGHCVMTASSLPLSPHREPVPQRRQTGLSHCFKTQPTCLSMQTRCLTGFCPQVGYYRSTSSFQMPMASNSGAAVYSAPFFLMGRIHWVGRHGCEYQTQGMSFICVFLIYKNLGIWLTSKRSWED